MGMFDRFTLPWRRTPATIPTVIDGPDLPLHEDMRPMPTLPQLEGQALVEALELRREATVPMAMPKVESITLGGAMSLDADEHQFRRLTSGQTVHRRDLSPLAQDRMLEIAWFLWEGNPFAKRLITLLTDLCLGEGVKVVAEDERIQEVIDNTWNHPVNQLASRILEFFTAEELSGELLLPVAVNPIDGRLTLGYIEPYQVKDIIPLDGNALIPDIIVMKAERGEREGKQFKVVRYNAESGMLEGDVFYHGINKLPNSLRGRSSLMPLADWLDLYDQYMFAEVERLHLLSSFVWDYKIEGAQSDAEVAAKVKLLPKPKPGMVFGHNEKETLEARTPDLKAQDRSEVARLLRVHIAGSFGFPLSYLGEVDSNHATIEGQNDILLKTPSRRQKDFASFLNQIISFGVQHSLRKNPALFKEAKATWKVQMPEIAAKDIARVGGVLASVASALDTSIANETMSKKTAITIQSAIIQHLGVDIDPQTLQEEIDEDVEKKQDKADELQASMAAAGAAGGLQPAPGPGGRRGNPPIPAGKPVKPPTDPVD